jgi:hypothetical protein
MRDPFRERCLLLGGESIDADMVRQFKSDRLKAIRWYRSGEIFPMQPLMSWGATVAINMVRT